MKSMRKKNGRLKEGKSMRQTESRQDAIKVRSIAPPPPLYVGLPPSVPGCFV